MKPYQVLCFLFSMTFVFSDISAEPIDVEKAEVDFHCSDVLDQEAILSIDVARETGSYGTVTQRLIRELRGRPCSMDTLMSFVKRAGYDATTRYDSDETVDGEPVRQSLIACRRTRRLATFYKLKCYDSITFVIDGGKLRRVNLGLPK